MCKMSNIGWKCPECSTVYAPFVKKCKCTKKEVVEDTEEFKIEIGKTYFCSGDMFKFAQVEGKSGDDVYPFRILYTYKDTTWTRSIVNIGGTHLCTDFDLIAPYTVHES